MKTKFIKIEQITDVQNFARMASLVEGDVICERGVYAVDGKSLLGLMSIDVSQGVTVTYPESAIIFDDYLNQRFGK